MNRSAKVLLVVLISSAVIYGQSLDESLTAAKMKKSGLEAQQSEVVSEIEDIRLQIIRRDLKAVGLPGSNIIEHSAMILEYSEPHEQARWVEHIISPEIITGTQYRKSNRLCPGDAEYGFTLPRYSIKLLPCEYLERV